MNYIVKHWRGELPLQTSFWINGVALSVVERLAIVATPWHAIAALPQYIVFGFAAFGVISYAWQVIGIWRSASNYEREEKNWLGTAAKVMVGISLIGTALLVRETIYLTEQMERYGLR